MSFFESSVRLSVNGFINKNRNMLTEVNIPSGSDFSSTILFNVGDVDNKGIEFRTDATLISGKTFEWNAALHCTLRQNRIKNLGSGIVSVSTGDVPLIPGASVMIQEIDMPVNSFYLLKQVYDAEGIPIQGLYEDYNNNGAPGFDDRYVGPSADPEFISGIWSSIKYRNWELSLSASAVTGNWCYNIESVFGNYGSMVSNGVLRNISNLVYESGLTGIAPYSDYHMQNGSFLRLDFASLKHTFRNVSEKNVYISLEATLQHALVLTAYKGADPDIAGGLPAYRWPVPRTASLRLNIDF